MTRRLLLFALLTPLAAPACRSLAPAPDATADAVARGFYSTVRRERIEGVPDPATLSRLRPWITPGLAARLEKARAEQAEAIRQHPGEKPPWIEGDLFSSSFEGVTSWSLSPATVRGDTAEATVNCACADGGQTVRWTDTVALLRTPAGWRVADVRYGGKWAFQAGSGSLARSLPAAP